MLGRGSTRHSARSSRFTSCSSQLDEARPIAADAVRHSLGLDDASTVAGFAGGVGPQDFIIQGSDGRLCLGVQGDAQPSESKVRVQ